MFAVIGKKIVDRLNGNAAFNAANDSGKTQELFNSSFPLTNTSGWSFIDPPTNVSISTSGNLRVEGGNDPLDAGNPIVSSALESLPANKTYIATIKYNAPFYSIRVNVGTTTYGNDVVSGEWLPKTGFSEYVTYSFTFKSDDIFSDNFYINFELDKASPVSNRTFLLSFASVKEVGDKKVFPVIIPQEVDYPAVTYEITNVTNFMSKGASLNSCNLSVRLACFADSYGTTYNQAKAIVEALDLYSVTYTEDGQSYTAKFRFIDLDDEYYKNAEKFYKNINFDCLIIKN